MISRITEQRRLYSALWWLAQELDNTAAAIGPAPDLAETCLRAHADQLRELITRLDDGR